MTILYMVDAFTAAAEGGRVMEGKMPNAGNKLVIETAPWTNGDAIRDMTDEELADWLIMNGNGSDYQTWLDWLRQEVEE